MRVNLRLPRIAVLLLLALCAGTFGGLGGERGSGWIPYDGEPLVDETRMPLRSDRPEPTALVPRETFLFHSHPRHTLLSGLMPADLPAGMPLSPVFDIAFQSQRVNIKSEHLTGTSVAEGQEDLVALSLVSPVFGRGLAFGLQWNLLLDRADFLVSSDVRLPLVFKPTVFTTFGLNRERGAGAPALSALFDMPCPRFFLESVRWGLAYRPSTRSVDSGNDDFSLSLALKSVEFISISGPHSWNYDFNLTRVWYGDDKNITSTLPGRSLPLKACFRSRVGVHYQVSARSSYSAGFSFEENPYRGIDESDLFAKPMLALDLAYHHGFSRKHKLRFGVSLARYGDSSCAGLSTGYSL
ncbi:MAG: hypothetical protein HQL31_02975 [Planctomycetes bacterium]|nr:hypothetical protein [Planctomycetota bacterium]